MHACRSYTYTYMYIYTVLACIGSFRTLIDHKCVLIANLADQSRSNSGNEPVLELGKASRFDRVCWESFQLHQSIDVRVISRRCSVSSSRTKPRSLWRSARDDSTRRERVRRGSRISVQIRAEGDLRKVKLESRLYPARKWGNGSFVPKVYIVLDLL